jgi:glycosyltransferase involved in cell wall biosynthesis
VLLAMLRHRPPEMAPACVFLDAGPVEQRVRELGAPAAVVRAGRVREAWRAPWVIRRLRAAIRAHEADLVFAHVTKAHVFAAPAARLERRPYLWWHHELPGQKPVLHALSARLPAAAVIVSSDFTAELHRRASQRVPIVRIHPGVEPEEGDAVRAESGRDGPAAIGTVGRLQRWKRVELVLEAMPLVLESLPGTRLRIFGDAAPNFDVDYPDELRARAASLGVSDAVDFAGHVDDVRSALRSLDALVHTAEGEPFGLVLVEAMLESVPVIAPDSGGPREIVRDGVDGLLVDVTNRERLGEAILTLLRDPEQRRRMGESAHAHALEHFTAERMARDAWAVAQRVAAGEPPQPEAAAPTTSS